MNFSRNWLGNPRSNVYTAAADAVKAAHSTTQPELQQLSPNQLAFLPVLERMEISLSKANDQTKAALGYLFGNHYSHMAFYGGYQPAPFTPETVEAMTKRLNGIHKSFSTPFLQFAGLYLPATSMLIHRS